MPATEIVYCPQCILFVFAAMGVYQYVVRDRIRNGMADESDELVALDIDEMDEATQLLLLEMLSADHSRQSNSAAVRPASQSTAA